MKAMNVTIEQTPDSSGPNRTLEASVNANTRQSGRSVAQPVAPFDASKVIEASSHTQQQIPSQPLTTYDPQGLLQPGGQAATAAVDGAFSLEPGAEYFGDFGLGMDDILFGFNASESIFQDFM